MNYNRVVLAGNLTRDPELRYTPKGTAIAQSGMAVNRVWKSESGEKQEETTFVDFEAWGRQAEVIAQYANKGKLLLIEGRLKLDQWEDKQTGQKRSKLKVVVENFQLGSGSREGAAPQASRPTQLANRQPTGQPADGRPFDEDDDVPF